MGEQTKDQNMAMRGKRVVVTGASSGIGRQVARALAAQGAELIMACRNLPKAEGVRQELLKEDPLLSLRVEALDLASFASIRAFASRLEIEAKPIDVLVNNAGAWTAQRNLSQDGIELTWAGNVLGPELLSRLLLPLLRKAGKARIVNVASTAAGGLNLDDPEYQKRPYNGVNAYSQTKQANRMLSWALAKELQGSSVTVNAMSPGLVKTELNRNASGPLKFMFGLLLPLMGKTPAQGADTAIWLASSPDLDGQSNKFWENRKEQNCKFRADADLIERLKIYCLRQVAMLPAGA